MKKDAANIIQDVLIIIEYTGDKEKFAKEFINVCYLKALDSLIKKLPSDKQEILREQLSKTKEADKVKEIIKEYFEYFEDEEYAEAVKKSSETLFKEWIETILPTLSESQKDKLKRFLNSLVFAISG